MERNAPSLKCCLDWDMFVDLNLGKLSENELETIGRHISTCPKCESKLLDWRNKPIEDNLARKIQQCLSAPALPDEPAFRTMETAAIAIGAPDGITPFHCPPHPSPRSTEVVGEWIGPYKVLEEIGHGGMGIVFRVRQHKVDRDVAVKMIRAGVYAGPDAFERFHKEAKAAGRLQHPSVVQLYDFAEHNGLPYVVMEYVNGGSLAKKLVDGPLSFHEAAELSQKVAEAVEFAHQNQVIHRDLKPSNILLAADGSPKISDFGLAKLLDDASDLTQTDTVLGTPSYMSPEQASGDRAEIGAPTDIYAIGAILYETITSQPPFSGENKIETIRMVREELVVPPSSLRQGVPRDLAAICLKCLEKLPSRRYLTAQALADDLGRWLRNEPPRDTPGWFQRTVRAIGRRRVRIGVIVALGTAVGLSGITAYVLDPERPLRQIQSDLKAGRPVTLIESVGRPRWQRWQAGEWSGRAVISKDGAVTIDAAESSLLELVPSPECDEYQIKARIRHDKASSMGGTVGIYFGHQSYPWTQGALQCFVKLTFNDMYGTESFTSGVGAKPLPRQLNFVQMIYHVHSEEGTPANINRTRALVVGSPFAPAGQNNGDWHDVLVTVSSSTVRVVWDGQSFEIDRGRLIKRIEDETAKFKAKYPDNPFVQAVEPKFAVRGGLGLYVQQGSASFSAVSVTPSAPAP
jgi:eukaryotic-like serine/threonine-protein kinase